MQQQDGQQVKERLLHEHGLAALPTARFSSGGTGGQRDKKAATRRRLLTRFRRRLRRVPPTVKMLTLGGALLAFGLLSVSSDNSIGVSAAQPGISLDGVWTFTSANGSIRGAAQVPGDIYTDLYRAGLTSDPLFGDNDDTLKWVGRTDWSYSKQAVDVPADYLAADEVLLRMDGIDTIASIYVNEQLVGKTDNQFREYGFPVKNYLRATNNTFRVDFFSGVNYANNRSNWFNSTFGHFVDPICPPADFHGECSSNMIRKIQSAYSWDWGPSFVTVGLWRSVALQKFIGGVNLVRFTAVPLLQNGTWYLVADFRIYSISRSSTDAKFAVHIDDLNVHETFTVTINPSVSYDQPTVIRRQISLAAVQSSIKLWWPNGHGDQSLYEIRGEFQLKGGQILTADSIVVGFRTVQLIQDPVNATDPSKGRFFYFRVNDVPIFLKGSNWIPISPFPTQNETTRSETLVDFARRANMNAMRVWGGGRYESDAFYSAADRAGILIWQDLMYACAMYPADKDFLANVRVEIDQQIARMKWHPSILIWAGNNENELAIMTGWWSDAAYTQELRFSDYLALYNTTIAPVVQAADPSRVYVMSSPSNGLESLSEGGLAKQPNSPSYGDIHFYNEYLNLWRDSSYQTPRCATEYGIQSLPSADLLGRHLNDSQLSYMSQSLGRRQHHPGGQLTLLNLVFDHFPVPSQCANVTDLSACDYTKTPAFLRRFVFYAQWHQAETYRVETEHYRRFQNRTDANGFGGTACALYWQLNDVWVAPSWSSVDYELNWKPSHYSANRFFQPLFASAYLDDSDVAHFFVANDQATGRNDLQLQVDVLTWDTGFTPIYTGLQPVQIGSTSAIEVPVANLTAFVKEWQLKKKAVTTNKVQPLRRPRVRPNANPTTADFIFRIQLLDGSKTPVAIETALYTDLLSLLDQTKLGDVRVDSVTQVTPSSYTLQLSATAPTLYVWLQYKGTSLQTKAIFSDNSFAMLSAQRTVTVNFVGSAPSQLTPADFTVCSLKNCGLD